jgi:hypothetical protein
MTPRQHHWLLLKHNYMQNLFHCNQLQFVDNILSINNFLSLLKK